MDQIEIDEINKTIPYMDGKIYWKENEWTSKLWEQMYENGWREVKEEDSEMVLVQDNQGRNLFAAEGRINMLRQLVNILI
jgi:predicted transcriptional regulator